MSYDNHYIEELRHIVRLQDAALFQASQEKQTAIIMSCLGGPVYNDQFDEEKHAMTKLKSIPESPFEDFNNVFITTNKGVCSIIDKICEFKINNGIKMFSSLYNLYLEDYLGIDSELSSTQIIEIEEIIIKIENE